MLIQPGRWGWVLAGVAVAELDPLRQFRRFFAAAVLAGPLVGATVGSMGTVFALGHSGMWQVWPKYFIGDALGVLVVAPLLLCWKEPQIAQGYLFARPSRAREAITHVTADARWTGPGAPFAHRPTNTTHHRAEPAIAHRKHHVH